MRAELRRPLFGLALCAAFLLSAPAARAVTYYVRTSGNDANSGLSPAAAWATVAHAANTLVAGDTVYVGSGTYTDAVDVQNSGSAGSPIAFVADVGGGFTGDAGPVLVDPAGFLATGFTIDGLNHIQVVGFRVTGGGRGFQVNNATGIEIRDCEIDGAILNGVEIDTSDVRIDGCDLHDHSSFFFGGAALQITGNSDVALVDSSVRDNSDQGIYLNQANASLTAEECQLYGNGGEAVFIDRGTAQLVNCLIRQNDSYGIWLNRTQSTLVAWHVTLADNGADGVLQQQGSATITNSIVSGNADDGLDRNGGTMLHSYNLVFGNGDQDYEGTAAGTGEISADPQFIGGGDYHLDAGSPALDAGTDSSAVTSQDLDGNARPSGSGWDLGAYERASGPHFAILHDGAATGCVPEPVTIEKHDASHAVDTAYTGTVSLTTTTGNGTWSVVSGSGTLVDAGGGSASYSFAPADAGRVVLGLQNPNVETLNIDVSDGADSEDPAEDPDLVFGGSVETYRDEFGSVSYANDDGTQSWSTPWIEVDGAGAGPAAGNALIVGGELSLDDRPNTGLDTSVEREADLSAFLTASFSFHFRTTSGVDANDAVFAEVSDDGGASWTVLERITGISGATTGSRSYDITGSISANTRIRLRVDGLNGTGGNSCCYGAANEEFLVDDLQILGGANSICGPNHFSFAHDGSGVNCQAENVTLTAHDATHGAVTDYTGTVALSTSTAHGDWSLVSGAGTLSNSGNGAGSYTFALADAGQVILGLRDTFVETVDLNVLGDGAIETEDPPLAFDRAGFQFLADGVASTVATQIAGKPSNVAPGQILELQAIRTSDQTGACEAALQGLQTVELAFTCEDPTTCAGALLDLSGTAIAPNPSGSPASYTAVDLDFGNATDTTAPFVLTYADVGAIQLHARKTLAPSGEDLLGASNVFVVRPFGFALDVPGNPGATGPAGAQFTAAGQDFGVDVGAVLWQAADDLDADGVPDGHANADPLDNASLLDNALAPSFGRETTPEGVTLSAILYAPAGGNDPGLDGVTDVTGWSGGSVTPHSGAYYDEVGVIEVAAAVTDGDYLGIGLAETLPSVGRSGPVGRFRPDHFGVAIGTAPVFDTQCDAGSFTYQEQPFGFATPPVLDVTALSARSNTTQNYTGAWWKITNGTLSGRDYDAFPAAPVLDESGLPPTTSDPAIVDLGGGTGTLTFDAGTGLFFYRDQTLYAPFDAEISLSIDVIDADGVAYTGGTFTIGSASAGGGIAFDAGKEQRYGRLVLVNAYGTELSDLPQPLRAEYWTASNYFAINGDDTADCTSIMDSHVLIDTANPAGLPTSPTVGNVPFLLSGDAGLFWSAPNAAGYADVRVDLSAGGADQPWLQWDWSGEGVNLPDQDPTARITFGIHAGDRPVIFRREVY